MLEIERNWTGFGGASNGLKPVVLLTRMEIKQDW
jgi:hypothetical protein